MIVGLECLLRPRCVKHTYLCLAAHHEMLSALFPSRNQPFSSWGAAVLGALHTAQAVFVVIFGGTLAGMIARDETACGGHAGPLDLRSLALELHSKEVDHPTMPDFDLVCRLTGLQSLSLVADGPLALPPDLATHLPLLRVLLIEVGCSSTWHTVAPLIAAHALHCITCGKVQQR